MEMEYEDFIAYASRYSQEGAFKMNNVKYAMNRFVKKEDIQFFYPKNVFVNEKELEVYCFKEDRILSFITNQGFVNIKEVKYQDIESVDLKYNDDYKPLELKILFRNGQAIELNDQEDTIQTWNREFTTKILDLFKFLQNK